MPFANRNCASQAICSLSGVAAPRRTNFSAIYQGTGSPLVLSRTSAAGIPNSHHRSIIQAVGRPLRSIASKSEDVDVDVAAPDT